MYVNLMVDLNLLSCNEELFYEIMQDFYERLIGSRLPTLRPG